MSYSSQSNVGNFLIQNTFYNKKPLTGLPTTNLSKIASNTGGNRFGVSTGSNVIIFPQSTSAPYAQADYMQLSSFIQGYEQGFKGSVMGPN